MNDLAQQLRGISVDVMLRQDRERINRQIKLTGLAEILQLQKDTVRRLGLRPDRYGARGREAKYLIDTVARELKQRNPDLVDVWPNKDGRFLTPIQAVQVLNELRVGPLVNVQRLAKWRHEGRGPVYIRVTRKAIRYRREDLEAWVAGGIPE
ncbi:MAG: hypothetical protein JNK40_02715 [Chromatiales bacterium]|nr:hypothetical protein [Chromatiales bacterium]